MLSKHASLSIKVVTTIFNTDCANPSIFQADLFVYTVCNRFGVLRYRDACPFCPFWTQLGYCCPLYILCMRGHENACFVPVWFQPHISPQQLSGQHLVSCDEFCCMNWGPFTSLMISWKHKGSSVHPVCIKDCFMPQEINSRWDVRAENVWQPFHWYCEH